MEIHNSTPRTYAKRMLETLWIVIGVAFITSLALSGLFLLANAQTTSAPTCTLTLTPSMLSGTGQSTVLSWTSTNAYGLSVAGIGSVYPALGGALTVTPTSTSQTYIGTVTGTGGSAQCQVTLNSGSTPNGTTATSTTATTTPSSGTATSTPGTGTSTPQTGSGQVPGSTATSTGSGGQNPTPPLTITYPAPGTTPAPMVLDVSSDGRVLVRGTVLMASANLITVRSWGGIWIVRTTPQSVVIPQIVPGDMSALRVGDFVGIDGYMSGQIYTIDATLVRDWTTHPYTASANTSSTDTQEIQASDLPEGSTDTTESDAGTESEE